MVYLQILLWFCFLLILPGTCILGATHSKWATRLTINAGGSLTLAIPTIFGLSLGLISVVGWIAYALALGFSDVRNLILTIIAALTTVTVVLMLKHLTLQYKNNWPSLVKFPWRTVWGSISIGMLALVATAIAAYVGPWFSHTADSFSHIAAVRSLSTYNRALPQEIFFDTQVTNMSPTHGTWHLALALIANLSGADPVMIWRFATVAMAPILVLAFAALALTLSQRQDATLLATVLYFLFEFLGPNFDVRVVAQPNRMGHIMLWLVVIFFVRYTRSAMINNPPGLSGETESQDWETKARYATDARHTDLWFIALLAFGMSAVHMMYPPGLIGLLGVAMVTTAGARIIVIVLARYYPTIILSNIIGGKRPNLVKNSIGSTKGKAGYPLWLRGFSGKLLSWRFFQASVVAVAAALPVFLYKTMILLSSPKVSFSNTLALVDSQALVSGVDLAFWYPGLATVTFLVSLLLFILFSDWVRGDIGAAVVIGGVLLVPVATITFTLFLGSGGLISSTIIRLTKQMWAVVYVAWGWQLAIVFGWIVTRFKQPWTRQISEGTAVVGAISILLASGYVAIQAAKGPLSIYSSSSTYKFRLAVSREGDLTVAWQDALAALQHLPPGAKVLSDINTSYMVTGLTGIQVVALPSQHTPVNQKISNLKGYWDAVDYMAGELDPREEVNVLNQHGVDYVFIGQRRFSGKVAWKHIPTIAVLEQIAHGKDWQLYRYNPENTGAYLDLILHGQSLETTEELINYYRQYSTLFSNQEQFAKYLEGKLDADASFALGYLYKWENYQTQLSPNVAYNFLDHLEKAYKVALNTTDIRRSAFVIDQLPKGVIFQRPPSRLIYQIYIPANAKLDFALAVAPEVWQLGKGDGVQFDIELQTDSGSIYRVFSKYLDPKTVLAHRHWQNQKVDLSLWSGQTVVFTFITSLGPECDNRYGWAGWGEPRIIQPIAYNFLEELPNADYSGADQEQVRQDTLTIDYQPRAILLQQPSSRLTYRVNLPEQAGLHFGLGIDPAVWSPEKGDGVEYNLYVRYPDEPFRLYRVFHRYLDPKNNPDDRHWLDKVVDLSAFGGQTVDVIFEILPGLAGDASFDWSGWSTPVLVAEDMALLNPDTQVKVEVGSLAATGEDNLEDEHIGLELGSNIYQAKPITYWLDDAENLIDLSLDFLENNQTQEAGDALERAYALAVEQNNKNASFWQELGQLLFEVERYELAIVAYENAIELDLDDVSMHKNLGLMYLANNQITQAGNHFEQIYSVYVEENVSNTSFWTELGQLLFRANRYDLAIASYTQVIELGSDNAGLRLELAQALQANGLADETIDQLERAFSMGVEESVNSDTFWLKLGQYYYQLGQYDSTIKVYKHLIDLGPDDPGLHQKLSQVYLENDQFQEAVDELENAFYMGVELNIKNKQFWREMGHSLVQTGQNVLAAQAFFRAQSPNQAFYAAEEANIEDGDFWVSLANLLYRVKQYELALTSYENAIQRNPKGVSETYIEKAQAYQSSGEIEQAVLAYKEAFNSASDNTRNRQPFNLKLLPLPLVAIGVFIIAIWRFRMPLIGRVKNAGYYLIQNKPWLSLAGKIPLWIIPLLLGILFFNMQGVNTSPDAAYYIARGLNIHLGRGYIDAGWVPATYRGTIFPGLIAISFWLFGVSVKSAFWAARLFYVLNVCLVYALGSKLFNSAVGLIAALLVFSSYTIHTLSKYILLDHIMPFFILLAQLLLVMAFEDKKKLLFVLSGLVLGIAVLTKDVALLFLPLPVLLWVLIPSYREGKSWQGVLLFFGVVLAMIASWYGYVYITGDGEIRAIEIVGTIIRRILSISVGGGIVSKPTPLFGLSPWLSTLWASLVFYYKVFLANIFPLAPLFLLAWGYVGYRACVKRSRSAIMLGTGLLLFSPLIIYLGRTNLQARQSFYLYLISYLALAQMLWAVVSAHPKSKIRRAIGVTFVLAALAVQVWGGEVGFDRVIKRNKVFNQEILASDLEVSGWHNKAVRRAARWLIENVDANEPILIDWEWRDSLYFYLNGRQPLHEINISANTGGPYLFVWTRNGRKHPDTKLFVLSESNFISQINELGIKYVIVTKRRNFFSIYLNSNPGFEQVANFGEWHIKIFKVKKSISSIPFYTHFEQNIPKFLKKVEITNPQRYRILEDIFINQNGWSQTQVMNLINGDIAWYETFEVSRPYDRGLIEISERIVDIPLQSFYGNRGVVVGNTITFQQNVAITSTPLHLEPGSYNVKLYGYGTQGQRDENELKRTPFIDVVVLKGDDQVSRKTVRLGNYVLMLDGPVFTIAEPGEVSVHLAYADDAGGSRKVYLSGVLIEETELPEGVFEVPIRSFDAYRDMPLEEWISKISSEGETIFMGENTTMTSAPIDLEPGSYSLKLYGYGTMGQRDENDEKRGPYIQVVVLKGNDQISRKTIRIRQKQQYFDGPLFTIAEPGEFAVHLVFVDDAGGTREVNLSEVYFEEVEIPDGVFEVPIRSFDAYQDMSLEDWISKISSGGETIFMGENTTMTSAPVNLEPGSYSLKLYGYGTKGQRDENDEDRTPLIDVVVLKDGEPVSSKTVRIRQKEHYFDGPVFTIAETGKVAVNLVFADDAGGARKVFLSEVFFEEFELPEGIIIVPIHSFDVYRDMSAEDWISKMISEGQTIFLGENTTLTSAPVDLKPGSYSVTLSGYGTKGQKDENDEYRPPFIDIIVLEGGDPVSRKTILLWENEQTRDGPIFTIAEPGEVSVRIVYADDAGGTRKVYLSEVYFKEVELPEGVFEVPIRSFDAYREMPLEEWISKLYWEGVVIFMGENTTMTSAPVDLEPGSYSLKLYGHGTRGQRDENDEDRTPFIDIVVSEGEDPISSKTVLLWENSETHDGPVFTIKEPGKVSVQLVYADDAGGARKVSLGGIYFEEVEFPEGVFEVPIRSFDAYREMPLEEWISKLYWEGVVIFMGENTTITSAPVDLEPGSYSVKLYGYGTRGQRDENDEYRTPFIDVVVLEGEDPISRKTVLLWDNSETHDGPVFTIKEPGKISVQLVYADDAGGARKVSLSGIDIALLPASNQTRR